MAVQEQHGQNAVAFYAGNPNVHNYGSMTHASVLRKAVQTKIHFSATSLDQLPHHLTSYSLYGHQSLIPVPDIDHTSYMLIIGGNPLASNGSIMTSPDIPKRLKAIQQRGGRFIVIDPRRTETAEIADQHLFIRPGTDAWLLMAMLNTLFAEDLISTGHLTDLLVGSDQVRSACAVFTPELAEQRTGVRRRADSSAGQRYGQYRRCSLLWPHGCLGAGLWHPLSVGHSDDQYSHQLIGCARRHDGLVASLWFYQARGVRCRALCRFPQPG